MNITGDHVRVRPTRHDDLPFLQSLWNDGEVMRHYGFPQGMGVTEAGMEQWWSMTPQGQTEGAELPLAAPHSIIELLDGTPIGELAYSIDAHQRARLDMKLARAYWRHGYGAEALQLAMRDLFATAQVVTVLMEPAASNVEARHLLQSCQFQPAPTENHPDRWECARVDFSQTALEK